MELRALGRYGLETSTLGLGCMGMSEFYGTPDQAEALRTIRRALDLDVTLIDTADMYGQGTNEKLVGEGLRQNRERAVLATKVGIVRARDGAYAGQNGRPDYIRAACEASLGRLGVDVIDLYQLHRVDPEVPIEESVGAMGELIDEGKVRFLGLSETMPQDIRRAAAAAPISALQNEYSLFERSIEDETLSVIEELGIGLLAYAPLGRGMLTGRYRTTEAFEPGDWRLGGPRWDAANLGRNLELVDAVERLATTRGVQPGQLALAWLTHQRPWVVPIPGTRRVRWVEENAAAADVSLSAADVAALTEAVPRSAIAGDRYPPERMPTWVTPEQ